MKESEPHYWKKLALSGQWSRLLDETYGIELNQSDSAAFLWRVRAYRALSRGEEANSYLKSGLDACGPISTLVATEYVEELLQCNYFDESKRLLNALVHERTPQSYFLLSTFFREQGKWNDAISSLEPARHLPEPWKNLSRIFEAWARLKQGWLGCAEELLLPFENDPTPATQKLLARLDLAAGRIKQAKIRLQKLSVSQPLDWEWPVLLATANAINGEPLDKCALLVETGLSRQPRQPEAHALMCRIMLAQKKDQEARKYAGKAMAVKPWLDAAVLPFVEQAVSQRRYGDARQILARAQNIADTPKRQAAQLDIMRLEGAKVRETLDLAEKLEKKFPEEPEVIRAVATAYEACGRRDRSIVLIERVLQLNPHDKSSRNNLAALYKIRGDIDDAINHWQALVEAGDEIAKVNLAQTLTERGDLAESEILWGEIARGQEGKSVIVKRGLATLYLNRGDTDKALAEITEACKREPQNAQNWLIKARIEELTSGVPVALKVLTEVQKIVDSKLQIRKNIFSYWRDLLKPLELVERVKSWRIESPNEIDYVFLEAKARRLAQDWDGTERLLAQAAAIDADEGTSELIRFYLFRGQFKQAEKIAQKWVADDSSRIRRWAQLAEVLYLQRSPEFAVSAVDEALKLDPYRISLVRQKIGILLSIERFDEAIASAKKLWETKPELVALSLWLEALERSHRFDEAVNVIKQALADRPTERSLRMRYALQLIRAGQDELSLQVLKKLIEDEPTSDMVARALIQILVRLDRADEAIQVMTRFAALQPERYDLQIVIAQIALEQGLTEQVRQMSKYLREKSPEMIDAWLLGVAVEKKSADEEEERLLWLEISKKFQAARWVSGAWQHWIRLGMESELERVLDKWRSDQPNNTAPWWVALRSAQKMHRYDLAHDLLDGIERRVGETPDVLGMRASILSEQWRISDSIKSVTRATSLAPIDTKLLEQLIGLQLKSGDWDDFDKNFSRLEYLLGDKRFQIYERHFFNFNCHPNWSGEQLSELYKSWDKYVVQPTIHKSKKHANSLDVVKKLRIGYISPDFRQHAVSKFSEMILAFHERPNFEIFAYAHLEKGQSDKITNRFKSYVDHWREIQHLTLDELERAIRKDNIDILVDLAGHTANHRLSIFTRRPAPVLASHVIGAGQTTGMSVVDYLIATQDIWPAQYDHYAAEAVERIPVGGILFRVPEDALAPVPVPCNERGYVTFGVFARPVRTNRRTIKVWAEILHKVVDSRLRFEHVPFLEPDIQSRFIEQFAEHGIGADRLEFNNTRPYWAAFQQIDIQLDPFPAGSGTTATEGLYMERLVVTLRDRPAMGRMAHAQLVALKLDDICSAADEQEYVQKAVALASDPLRLAELSSGLRQRFENSPITDYKGYANALATTYRRWWKTWCEQQAQSELSQ